MEPTATPSMQTIVQFEQCLVAGKYQEMIHLASRLLDQDPAGAFAYWWLGLALWLQGQPEQAEDAWFAGLSHSGEEGLTELLGLITFAANHQFERGYYQSAADLYRQILEQNPQSADLWKRLGTALIYQGQPEEAAACYQQAIALHPLDSSAHINLGVAWKQMHQDNQAIACYRRALEIDPQQAIGYHNLGDVLFHQGKTDEAIAAYEQALALQPSSNTYINWGVALMRQGQYHAALNAYKHAIQIDPYQADAYNNLGLVLHHLGEFESAMTAYEQALALDPHYAEACWNQALLLLQQGDLERGFRQYETRWTKPSTLPRSFAYPLWQGEEIAHKTLLVWSEQGLGDTLQFIRYVPLLAQRGARVIVECPPVLARLVREVAGVAEVVSRQETPTPADYHLPMMSLPARFSTTLETIPAHIPYLQTTIAPVLDLSHESRPKVGIVWGIDPNHPGRDRSCPLTHWLPLLRLPEFAFYSLQKGPPLAELALLPADCVVHNLNDWMGDFADTATIVQQMDLIIAIDTAVAHLAGGMGKPVWLLSKAVPEWRWLRDRDDSPWYPTLRLFQQPQAGDWQSVIQQVATQILICHKT